MGNKNQYDVIVIGGGVVGTAITRQLTRYDLNVALIEKNSDVSRGTSGKNSGVVHTGFNVPTGSVKAELNVAGAKHFESLCEELGVPFKRVGKLVVALTKEEIPDLRKLKEIGDANGVPELAIIGEDEVNLREPNVRGIAALHAPTAAITCPYTLTIALAESAALNGADILLNKEVKKISGVMGGFQIGMGGDSIQSKLIINSAGLYSDQVARLAGVRRYKVWPCRGEYVIIDNAKSNLLTSMVYPVPPKGGSGLGVHITPTIDGNILLGPSAEYVKHKRSDGTSGATVTKLLREAQELLPALDPRDVITSYAGIRPKTVSSSVGGFGDFIIEEALEVPGMMNLVGIESPGLTAAPAIAEKVSLWVEEKLGLQARSSFVSEKKRSLPFRERSFDCRQDLINEDASYGQIVCRCEMVTRKEIVEAIQNPLGVQTLSGIKYRSRAMMGRCQGGFCSTRIVEIMTGEFKVPSRKITLKGRGSELFIGSTKEARQHED
ncbi:MAG TPA: NAD(P)/FAD-dependent oxidoreductase [SAR202 cluster bacterium]|jgi:glycerol-3-phosphate dehydrogenase|nr:NAD(P)/FAD-dependent oxidoreductase [SAR202 cluster bacterium]|tara:strand:- start:16319 stop:17800 length:1482 start_codon:yes stop_codon:yes gene_type:complete